MKWTFSDGTVLHIGGKVDGESPLAMKLKQQADEASLGRPHAVQALPPPGLQLLNVDDPWHVHVWAHEEALRAGIAISDAPTAQAPSEWNEPESADENALH